MPDLHTMPGAAPEDQHPDLALLAAGALLDTLIAEWVPLALREEQIQRDVARLAHANGWATLTTEGMIYSYAAGSYQKVAELERQLGADAAAEAETRSHIAIDHLADFIRSVLPTTPAGLACHARALRWSFNSDFFLRPPPPDGEEPALVYDFLNTVERVCGGRT